MKIIRLIIALSLILGSLALDMSSVKNRASTSAYVELYTELGFNSGFRQGPPASLNWNPEPEKFQYYIQYTNPIDSKIKLVGDKSTQTMLTFVDRIDGTISFKTTDAWNSLLPQFIKSKCNSTICKFTTNLVKSFSQGKSDNYFFTVVLQGQNKSFKIILTNGVDAVTDPSNEVGLPTMTEQVNNYENATGGKKNQFAQHLILVIENYTNILKWINDIKKKQANLQNVYKANTIALEGKLEKKKEEKNKLVNEIDVLNTTIATQRTSITNLQSKKNKCNEELINIILQISNETKRIEKAKSQKAENIAKNTESRTKAIKNLFYYIEASYFYRVFAEKLIKKESEVLAAFTGTNFITTKTKIVNAFFPIPIDFASQSAK